ncbi:DUF4136 domain-containing protein [Thalassotalea sp. LPB0316]|uniref:DUF4136 domain-containing protein n=1 Tax=Thalassotalea sp. LPB0316 TaxID=2769490 RepID=UPI0018676E63|nr:DUF4136 domain-containing protein [Thalassotalea sp. LPB0316]QOL26063.1 DUF4136 domain-containing protein [Thalassotalea sp. LPB0316]
MRYLAIFLLVLTALGCSSPNKAETKYLVPFDFDSAKTYGFHELNSRYSQQQNMSHAMRNSIELAIERQFDKLGFRYAKEQPDIIIGYRLYGVNGTIFNGRKEEICRDCRPSKKELNKARQNQQAISSIMLDVQSGKSQLSVWRASYPLSLKGDENSVEFNREIDKAINEIVAKYPKNNREQQVVIAR